jgi:hypothetical protein
VPVDPAPTDPAPADPTPVDPAPPAIVKDPAPTTDPTPPTAPALPWSAPAAGAPALPPAASSAAVPATPGATPASDAPLPPSVVGAALAQLGIAPPPDTSSLIAPMHVCAATIVTSVSVPGASNYLVPPTPTSRPHRALDDPPTVRGPPLPLDAPSAPVVAGAAAAAAAAGSAGSAGVALLLVAATLELPQSATEAPAPTAAPPTRVTAGDGARAPPVS